ncbi:MAG: Hsp20 family protein [Spirochaetia bacterium]
MKDKIVIDIGRIMDDIFEAAQEFGDAMNQGFNFEGKRFGWDESMDYYPSYSYPPTNVYMKKDRTLIFEFALAGFDESQISLEFRGDYMIFSATAPTETLQDDEEVRYFKRRLKLKDIKEQKYYVPADKFNREEALATFKDGLLRVVVEPKEKVQQDEGIRVNIIKAEKETKEGK